MRACILKTLQDRHDEIEVAEHRVAFAHMAPHEFIEAFALLAKLRRTIYAVTTRLRR